MANAKNDSLAVAVAEKPVEETKKDNGLRTVLHGWGKLVATERHDVDGFTFVGGVARNVPVEVAEAMLSRRSPEKNKPKYGYIVGHILPSDATDADFIKATGIRPMPLRNFASMLGAYTPVEMRQAMGEAMGDEKAADFVKKLAESFGVKL